MVSIETVDVVFYVVDGQLFFGGSVAILFEVTQEIGALVSTDVEEHVLVVHSLKLDTFLIPHTIAFFPVSRNIVNKAVNFSLELVRDCGGHEL